MSKAKMENVKWVNKMALPALAGTVVETIFSIADQAIIGRTSVEGYAAVGVVANILYLLTGTLGILSLAFTIMFGKVVGTDDKQKAAKIFNTTITITFIIGSVFGIISCLFCKQFFAFFYHFKGVTLKFACDYMRIACWGLLLNMLIFIIGAYLKNLRHVKICFFASTIALIINFCIDYTLVFGKFGFPKLQAKGAAIGTVAGLFVNVLIYAIWFVKIGYTKYKVQVCKEESIQLIKIYIPLLGQDFVEYTLFVMLITSIVTNLSVCEVASYNLLESFITIVLLPVFAYAGATLTLVTQAFAKKEMEKVRSYPVIALFFSMGAVILIGGAMIAFPEFTSSLITNDSHVIKNASYIIPFAIGIQLLNIVNQIYKYCLQGTSCENWVFVYSLIISAISCGIAYINVIILELGLKGVYIGLGLSYVLLGMGYFIKYRRTVIGEETEM